jgi:hypothetical protein
LTSFEENTLLKLKVEHELLVLASTETMPENKFN